MKCMTVLIIVYFKVFQTVWVPLQGCKRVNRRAVEPKRPHEVKGTAASRCSVNRKLVWQIRYCNLCPKCQFKSEHAKLMHTDSVWLKLCEGIIILHIQCQEKDVLYDCRTCFGNIAFVSFLPCEHEPVAVSCSSIGTLQTGTANGSYFQGSAQNPTGQYKAVCMLPFIHSSISITCGLFLLLGSALLSLSDSMNDLLDVLRVYWLEIKSAFDWYCKINMHFTDCSVFLWL